MANGFLDTSPVARHGASSYYNWQDDAMAQGFTLPGSGTISITEVGAWVLEHTAGAEHQFALFTDDAGNSCPEAMVADSQTPTLYATGSWAKSSHTYGTPIELTGGVFYWIGMFSIEDTQISYASSTGENSLATDIPAAWPEGDQWHTTESLSDHDFSLFAVYEAAAEDLEIDEFESVGLVEDITAALSDLGINENEAVNILEDVNTELSLILEQEGFRWRDDDDSESAAAWLVDQDVDTTRLREVNIRLRFLINATGDHDEKQFKIQYKKTSDATWRDMPES